MTPAEKLVAAAAAALREALQEELGDVAIDPRNLRPAELVRLLNSTPLGEALTERRLRDHRARAGFRISDGRHVDLFRYAAWLAEIRHQAAQDRPQSPPGAEGYELLKEQSRARRREVSDKGRDIGPLPPVADPKRRAAAEKSLATWLVTYFPRTFEIPFSPDHVKLIGGIQRAAESGGLLAYTMPRGFGKTSICERAALWAVICGLHSFVAVIGAEASSAAEILQSMKTELETNELVLADYPEVCYPIACLEGEPRKCTGQHLAGVRTRITWGKRAIVLPTIEGSRASGAILKTAGLTARIRGMKHQRADGTSARPSFVLLDDPQSDRAARSATIRGNAERTLAGAILYLSKPGRPIAAVCPCTVICPGDLADSLLDPTKHPEWESHRCKAIYAFPTNQKHWDRYADLLRESKIAATAYYRRHRKSMDRGAKPAWPERYDDDELSAVQHCMNRLLRDREAFFAEYQNEPLKKENPKSLLSAELVAGKLSGLARARVPQPCQHLAAYVDVHGRVLYYVVSAWAADFGGGVIDYGTYPKQPVGYFAQASAPVAMEHAHPGLAEDARILAGLGALTDELLTRTFEREDGAELRIGRLFVDCKWGEKNKLLKAFCRRHPQAGSVVWAAQGIGLGASSKPFDEYRPEAGAQLGLYWRVPPAVAGDRWVTIDVNWWKSFAAGRLALAPGTPGGWCLFGRLAKTHALFADHCVAEEPVETTARGRTVDEWKWKPGRPDNHYWDCLVGSAVAGSMLGARPAGMEIAVPIKPGDRPTLAELAKRT